MKILLFSGGLYLLSSIGIKNNADIIVFYCDSPTGKKYHFSEKCRGLQKCTHTIRETTVLVAKKKNLTVCLIEK